MDDRETLLESMERRLEAVRTRDADALINLYAEDVATFDLVAPFANVGAAAVRRRVEAWFESFDGDIGYEIRDVVLILDGTVAFDHHLTHVRGTSRSGEAIAMWFRETVGYRRIDGRWWVVHQHSSVPLDMETGRPLLELQPPSGQE